MLRLMQDLFSFSFFFFFFYFYSNKNVQLFNGALFISKYLLFIGYIQNALTVNFHSIFTIVSSSAPVTDNHRGVTGETVDGHIRPTWQSKC